MNHDDGGSRIFLGLFFFGFVVWMLSKIATDAFHALARMFHAIGDATLGFLEMLWALVQFAGILGFGVLLIYAVYKFVRLVKRGTEIMESVELRLAEFQEQLKTDNKGFQSRVAEVVNRMNERLEEALREPEAASPEVPQAVQESVAPPQLQEPRQESAPTSAPSELPQPADTDGSTVPVHNRY